MSDFTQNSRTFESPGNANTSSGPNAFQDFAANLWGGPSRSLDQSGGATRADGTAFKQAGGSHPAAEHGHIDEIPGILTKLDGVTKAPKTEVTVQAKVAKLLPDFDNPRNGLKHEQFVIEMSDGTDVFCAHDLNYAPRVPLSVGEAVQMKGEWIPTPRHENHGGTETIGVLHWTHHSENENKHPSGYIEAAGQHYE